jgi:Methyltransferase domain
MREAAPVDANKTGFSSKADGSQMSRLMRRVLRRIPIANEFAKKYDFVLKAGDCPGVRGLGGYTSPIPSLSEIKADHDRIFAIPRELPGIDLNAAGQRALGLEIAPFVADFPLPETHTPPWRFHGDQGFYSGVDALVLYAMLRHFRPGRVVEVGSGYSSALILDTVEHYLGGTTRCTFIEPYPDRLHSLLRPDDQLRCKVIVDRVQNVALDPFLELSAGDFLVIDSSHVSKVGSDVNGLIFEVLPQIAPGVVVHVHDIWFPFEYPAPGFEWGRSDNEAYILRAFLIFNRRFEIIFWNHYLRRCETEWVAQNLPRFIGPRQCSSIWLRATS